MKPRVLVSTDIGGTDPDDNQSMLHLLWYNDLFDLEGLVSSPSYGSGSKEEILRMIDLYEQDYPRLNHHNPAVKSPDSLRSLCKQGRRGLAPYRGFDTPTEGSEWIVQCARREDSRPLWVLVWGSLEDVAQALHDAPDMAGRLHIYYIGGPNKKWGVNSYTYIAEHFPNLWMIENNASYRGFISNNKDSSAYHTGFYQKYMKDAGHMGQAFGNYYGGDIKMGDTPSLLYMMNGDPEQPEGDSYGGSFERLPRSPRRIIDLGKAAKTLKAEALIDTVPVYSVVEMRFQGKRQGIKEGTPCFTLTIDKQNWQGCYIGKGRYAVRYSPKQSATLPYTIVSDNDAFPRIEGRLVVDNTWPGKACDSDFPLGQQWWTDRNGPEWFEGKWQGAATVGRHRREVLEDWIRRLSWLQ